MRAGFVALLLVAGCSTASIGDEPGSDIPLPDRGPDAPSAPPPVDNQQSSPLPSDVTISVTLSGMGAGAVSSTPSGVTCAGKVCSGKFASGTSVTLAATPSPGSMFGGWSGGACTGTKSCTFVASADAMLTAEVDTLDGTWAGMYTHSETVQGCTFHNMGTLTAKLATSMSSLSSSANVTGLELRDLSACTLVSTTTGAAPSSADMTAADGKITGTWTFAVQGANGNLPLPFSATLSGKTLTGSWTCTGCTGSFTLTKM
jgi:hypothetical protein